MESNDKMRMTNLHPGLKLGVFVPWRNVSAMTGEAVLQEIMKVLQSNENFRINDRQMTIQVTVVRLPVGSGHKPLHIESYDCLKVGISVLIYGFHIIMGSFRIIMGAFDIIMGSFRILMDAFRIIMGAFDIIMGSFRIIMDAFRIIMGAFCI